MYFKHVRMKESSVWKEMGRFCYAISKWESQNARLEDISGLLRCDAVSVISCACRFERTRCVPAVPQRDGQGSESSGQRGVRTVRRPAYGGKRAAFCGKFEAKARVLRTSAGTNKGSTTVE